MWGTGVDEYRVGLKELTAQFNRDFSQSEKSEIQMISFASNTAESLWAAAICNTKITINAKEYFFENLRITIIIEKEEGAWKISHMHASFPDYRNPENCSFPIDDHAMLS